MAKKQQQTRRDPDLLARLASDVALAGRLLFDRRVSGTAKFIPLAMVAYILSPLDLVPDILLPFGLVDDISVFLIGLRLFIRSAPPEVLDEYRSGKKPPKTKVAPGSPVDDDKVPMVIDGQYEVRDDVQDN